MAQTFLFVVSPTVQNTTIRREIEIEQDKGSPSLPCTTCTTQMTKVGVEGLFSRCTACYLRSTNYDIFVYDERSTSYSVLRLGGREVAFLVAVWYVVSNPF